MSKIKIAIIGRPNVGKSSLFNRITGKRISLVDSMEGITRDRVIAQAECFGRFIELIDTGGIDDNRDIPYQKEVKSQVERALAEADGVIFVVDGRVPVAEMDREISAMLKIAKKPFVLAVNKCDAQGDEGDMQEYHALGVSDTFFISANHGNQVADLLQLLINQVSILPANEEPKSAIKLAFVGRTNVGKSTLLNQILGEERAIVSPQAGTTRDAIDSDIVVDGQHFMLIDTAGIRKKRAEKDPVDKFAAIRTEEAIQRADVCAIVLDAREGMTHIEKKILMRIEEEGKGCLVFINKWDLVKGFRMEHVMKELMESCPALNDFPILIGSALQKRNIQKIFKEAKEIYTQLMQRIPTGQLNRFMEKAIQKYHPPMIQGKRLRIFYLTQVDVHPPTFVLFVNRPDLMTDSYKKYLLNQFRETYAFKGIPIKIELKPRSQKPS